VFVVISLKWHQARDFDVVEKVNESLKLLTKLFVCFVIGKAAGVIYYSSSSLDPFFASK
jgi:hypothetical protein